MKELYIVTGANGHLGSALIKELEKKDCEVRGLILPGEQAKNHKNITYYEGDVRDKDSLRPLLRNREGKRTIVIHTAGIVAISEGVSPQLYDVNVNGAKNVVAVCLEEKADRLVYVSSVHAIPEKTKPRVLREVDRFSAQWVEGGYAKTKAEATQAVLDAAKQGLDAVVVHPSGILGPYNGRGNHLVQMVEDYLLRRLPACVKGGYDFVDVRDVARGCLLAAEKGKSGECYILSNRHYDVKEVLGMVRENAGGRRLPVLPMWMAKMAAPLLGWYAKLKKERPLYTRYSLYTLSSNDRFSHDKATKELGWQPRDLSETIADTVTWIQEHPEKKKRPVQARKRKAAFKTRRRRLAPG
ncbi:MAG: NAD-dependent epimerase/dehydratase family protein [Oscillospiraceae bacterium]|nr:NAD-dependent epimerase/dehydratase family protein [Oscillospiraceae bacterium]